MNSPLGPIRVVRTQHTKIYLDAIGNEFTSVEHVLRCAIAKELGL